MLPHIFLDLADLLQLRRRSVPDGISRVIVAYARHYLEHAPERTSFVGFDPLDRIQLLRSEDARDYISGLEALWQGQAGAKSWSRLTLGVQSKLLFRSFDRHLPDLSSGQPSIHVYAGIHHLPQPAAFERFKQRSGARLVCLVHDLIPLRWPEYCLDGEAARHAARMKTVSMLADGIITNSQATADQLRAYLGTVRSEIPICPAMLSGEIRGERPTSPSVSGAPYFVVVGTIEPRKNLVMLLEIWRGFVAQSGAAAPRLLLLGLRGWKYDPFVEFLKKNPQLAGIVREVGAASDTDAARIIAGARALLMPSFDEGFGLPVAESLTLGVPVLASDIPSLREIGKGVPEFFDAADGNAWRATIADYARPDSAGRAAQLARLASWHAPTWHEHFQKVDDFLERVANMRAPRRGAPSPS